MAPSQGKIEVFLDKQGTAANARKKIGAWNVKAHGSVVCADLYSRLAGEIVFVCSKQHEEIIEYDNYEVGRHRFDFLVENKIIVELKTIKNLEDIHFAIVRSYLKSINKKHGLLLNFSKMPLEIKRVIYE